MDCLSATQLTLLRAECGTCSSSAKGLVPKILRLTAYKTSGTEYDSARNCVASQVWRTYCVLVRTVQPVYTDVLAQAVIAHLLQHGNTGTLFTSVHTDEGEALQGRSAALRQRPGRHRPVAKLTSPFAARWRK